MQTPKLHKPISMKTRVKIAFEKEEILGTVYGISIMDIIFHYLVILDKEVDVEFGKIKCVSIPGTELIGLNNENWRM